MERYDFTQDVDIFQQVLEYCDASLDSFVTLLRLRCTCHKVKRIVDTILLPGQKAVPRWLAMLHARTSTITDNEVLANVNGGAGTKEHPRIGRKYKYIKRAEVFRTLEENYFFDERLVRMIFNHMRTEVYQIIEATETSITHDFQEATLLLGDVCINAMWCHVKNRDIVLHGCYILEDIQNKTNNSRAHIGQRLPLVHNFFVLSNIQTKASNECAFITRQLQVLTDALHHHRSDVAIVSVLLRFVDGINQQRNFFGYTNISECSVEICDKFSAALADVMQYHMHATEWVDAQTGVVCYQKQDRCE